MPKGFLTKNQDKRETEMQAVINAGIIRMHTTKAKLSKKCGIPYSTFTKALREPEYMGYVMLKTILDELHVPAEERTKIL